MRPLRPPIRDDYTNSYSNNNPTPSKLRPPIPDQNRNNNNSNNNINNPFPSQTPKFSKPNNIDSQKNDDDGQNNSSSFDNDDQSNTSEQAYKAQNKTPMHKTSQKHKTPDSSYNINPTQIPRPNQFDEIYFNNEKLPFYETNIGTPPPHSTTFYSVKETQNSSCRFIRPTLNSIPISQSLLNETNLLFGICVQPFAEIPEYEASIPKVESGNNIFRCRQCNSYINNKYNISFSAQNKQVAICNLCQYENELDINKPGIKSDYLNSDYSNCPELTKPTVDFIAPTNFKASKIFVPHYLFMIDISETSFQLGLPSYVINSIQSNLESVHNKENSYIGFGLYDQKNIYYFYIEKDNPRLTIMGDIINPFCPVSLKKLFLKLEEKIKSTN